MTQPKNTINGGHGLTTTENERENKQNYDKYLLGLNII